MSYIIIVLGAWIAVIGFMIYWFWIKDMGKETVEIYNAGSLDSKKKYAKEKGHIVLRKGAKGRGPKGWIVPIKDAYIYYKTWFGFKLSRKLMIVQDHDNFIEIKQKFKSSSIDMSRFDVDNYWDANLVKNKGHTLTSLKIPFMLYMVLGIGLILNIFTLLVMSGRLRL